MRHELAPDESKIDHWIEIRPIQDLKAKDRDAYESVAKFYIKFDEQGRPDMSGIPVSMSLQSLQRTALLSRLITAWSFTCDDGITGLPLPRFENGEVVNAESPGEIPIDYWDQIEDILAPYLAKVQRKPDPKGTTTASSNGTSRGPVSTSRKG